MGFHWILRDSKSPQISMTLLSILADLNNAVVWIVFTRPLILSVLVPVLGIIPSAPIIISITVAFMLNFFFFISPCSKPLEIAPTAPIIIGIARGRCPWCNGFRRRKWTRRHEFKSCTRLIAFHIALIPLGKV